jgi:rhomboid family GlyGly-CTERM serine protease
VDKQKSRCIGSPVPLLTLSIVVVTIITYLSPVLTSILVYDRAAISTGQFWRLLSGHMVHFNDRHIVYNLTAFVLTAWILEAKTGHARFGLLCTFIMLAISVFLLNLKPKMIEYGGLSGLVCGLFVYLGLIEMGNRGPWRMLWLPALLIIPLKIVFECYTGKSILPYPQSLSFVPVWEGHAIGSLSAIAAFLARKLFENKGNEATAPT